MQAWRQGDVYVARIGTLPDGCKPRSSLVLVKGEATGHAHRLEQGADVDVFSTPSDDPARPGDVFYVAVRARPARLVHEEHCAIILHPGCYRIWRQREYSPAAIRTVVD